MLSVSSRYYQMFKSFSGHSIEKLPKISESGPKSCVFYIKFGRIRIINSNLLGSVYHESSFEIRLSHWILKSYHQLWLRHELTDTRGEHHNHFFFLTFNWQISIWIVNPNICNKSVSKFQIDRIKWILQTKVILDLTRVWEVFRIYLV